MMTGNVPSKNSKPVSHTEGFTTTMTKMWTNDSKGKTNQKHKAKTTKNIINPVE